MPAQLIDGKALAEKILLDLKNKIAKLKRRPGLAAILIGDDPASILYIKNKKLACEKIGLNFHAYFYGNKTAPNITQQQIIEMISWLNSDDKVDGIIVQLPIPKKFNSQNIINKIKLEKDVDGFRRLKNINSLVNYDVLSPPLIEAVKAALKSTSQNLSGKTAVIICNSPIFSEPMKTSLEKNNIKVKIIKPEKNFSEETKKADILIIILGKKYFIKQSMVKPNAIVIDIGTNLIGKNKWAGDVDPKVAQVASWLTPVPGGIGPLTVTYLLKNVYDLALKNQKSKTI
ncbi:MAG: hypothetical protein A2729_01095 [Candidatus Buchananbacteria bacterium RIFCSPHIGHO2_01_FULL_39_14]|uniref:Bifunctional protein FolD n=2 Tax=Candidatus Buchananiibacteriota TaxID=1817903 RepID=A0A1G1YU80_9BACT|nr:MAG: hypothetical protein A2729_01095 [Candidatus Buchananbacteria bacterium RIFCSPHIGHO2_01_FULL_39_14]OGY49182.1 MAG: hypothetical protein A3D39_05745 [Candidatus Buchananbacteria bacterium RIFCSPHIGHO2_02_FULL_39_17]OGY55915.1 MAG: hypothetical protein A2912_02925 [Candidatus Buchananbacteria bacterium RIFCSPLOWO2_01_FULL_40_23b]